ncbi:helix-turn-helix domain-containing protein [Amycolatopsis lexingtonensis]|uniref:helix-turn-helix domain-containing protein n=1 Tax=Amycolatopsis lexingtonensis TaxID=218822 RepID=UPI003F71F05C
MSEAKDLNPAETEPFGKLLERLINVKKHPNGRSYSVAEVAEDVGISKSQLYNLINGANEPKLRLVQKLAAYFGVDLEYFGTSRRARELQEQYALLAKLSAHGVRDVALRASTLSSDALSSVRAFIDFQASRETANGHTSE